jgi:hypothetical protein
MRINGEIVMIEKSNAPVHKSDTPIEENKESRVNIAEMMTMSE